MSTDFKDNTCLIFCKCNLDEIPLLPKIKDLWLVKESFSTGVALQRAVVATFGVITRFLQSKNDPSGRREWTPGHFSTLKNDHESLFGGVHYSSLHRRCHECLDCEDTMFTTCNRHRNIYHCHRHRNISASPSWHRRRWQNDTMCP